MMISKPPKKIYEARNYTHILMEMKQMMELLLALNVRLAIR